MNKSALSRFTLKLAIGVLLVNFVFFWGTRNGTLLWGLKGVLIFVVPPLVLPLAFIKVKPEISLGGVLFFMPLLAFCYYHEFIAPYAGGGAKMTYALTWIFGFPLVAFGMVAMPFVFRILGIEVIDDT